MLADELDWRDKSSPDILILRWIYVISREALLDLIIKILTPFSLGRSMAADSASLLCLLGPLRRHYTNGRQSLPKFKPIPGVEPNFSLCSAF
jgi:hypothetical protein